MSRMALPREEHLRRKCEREKSRRAKLLQDPAWVEAERERCRLRARELRKDPAYKQREKEKYDRYYANNREKVCQKKRDWMRLYEARIQAAGLAPARGIRRAERRLGLPAGWFAAKEKAQGGLCACCGQRPPTGRLDIDHDHSTGAVRDLLCNGCNTSFGILGENKDRILRLHAYAVKHGK